MRNIAVSAPYMHDGRFGNLAEVLRYYSTLPQKPPIGHIEESLIPLNLTDEETTDLTAFLKVGLQGQESGKFASSR